MTGGTQAIAKRNMALGLDFPGTNHHCNANLFDLSQLTSTC